MSESGKIIETNYEMDRKHKILMNGRQLNNVDCNHRRSWHWASDNVAGRFD